MEDQRFDRITRALGSATTRRAGIGAAIAGALGFVARSGDARGGSVPRPAGPCGDGTRTANVCTRNNECCTGYCEKGLPNRDGQGRCRCLRKGETCKNGQACCSGLTCKDKICTRPAPCRAENATCASDAECCAGLACTGGICVTPACRVLSESCSASSETCCSGLICGAGQIGLPNVACHVPIGGQCTSTTDCVAGSNCSNSVCVANDPACVPTATTAAELQAAVDAAKSGDTITLAEGNYVFKTPMTFTQGQSTRQAGLAVVGKDITLRPCPGAPVILTCPDALNKFNIYSCVALQVNGGAAGLTMSGIDIDSTQVTTSGVYALAAIADETGSAVAKFSNGVVSAFQSAVTAITLWQTTGGAANSVKIQFGSNVTVSGSKFGIISATPTADQVSTAAVTCKDALTFNTGPRRCISNGTGATISKTCGC